MAHRIAYAGCLLDRAVHLRAEAAGLAQRLGDATARVVPVWRDRSLVTAGSRPRLLALAGEAAGSAVALAGELVFLGLDGDGGSWFACDLSPHDEPSLGHLVEDGVFTDLGRVVTLLPADEAAVLAYARAMAHWHRRHRFCGVCGSPTEARQGGHLRQCVAVACAVQNFPRTDPVVIMLVTRADAPEACLLGRQKHWMPGLMSALAGFVEPGETLEEAVRREVREEAGLDVDAVAYQASQPWPFPSSLMLGFRARARPGATLVLDDEELEEARWFSRDEVADMRGLGLRLPFRGTIARALIDGWLAGDQGEGKDAAKAGGGAGGIAGENAGAYAGTG